MYKPIEMLNKLNKLKEFVDTNQQCNRDDILKYVKMTSGIFSILVKKGVILYNGYANLPHAYKWNPSVNPSVEMATDIFNEHRVKRSTYRNKSNPKSTTSITTIMNNKRITSMEMLDRLKNLYKYLEKPKTCSQSELSNIKGFNSVLVGIVIKNGLIKKVGASHPYSLSEYVWSSNVIPNIKMAEAVLNKYRQSFTNFAKNKANTGCVGSKSEMKSESKTFEMPITTYEKKESVSKLRILKFNPHMLAPNIIDMLNDIEVIQCNSVDGKNFQLTIKGHL